MTHYNSFTQLFPELFVIRKNVSTETYSASRYYRYLL